MSTNLFQKLKIKFLKQIKYNWSAARVKLVQRECDTSYTSATRVTQVQHQSKTSATPTTRLRRECYANDKSATQVRNFDFDNDTSENIFSYVSYMINESHKQRNNFILETTFGNVLFPCQNAFETCTAKAKLCNSKSYINKLYTRLQLQMLLHFPAQLAIVMQSRFR